MFTSHIRPLVLSLLGAVALAGPTALAARPLEGASDGNQVRVLGEIRLARDARDVRVSKVKNFTVIDRWVTIPLEPGQCYGDSSDCRDREEAVWVKRPGVIVTYWSEDARATENDTDRGTIPTTTVREEVMFKAGAIAKGAVVRYALEERMTYDRIEDERASEYCDRFDNDLIDKSCEDRIVFKNVPIKGLFLKILAP